MTNKSNKEIDQRILDEIRSFCRMSEECELDILTLLRVRDQYFPVLNTRRCTDPVMLAGAVRLLEGHVHNMRKLLYEVFHINLDDMPLPGQVGYDYPKLQEAQYAAADKESKDIRGDKAPKVRGRSLSTSTGVDSPPKKDESTKTAENSVDAARRLKKKIDEADKSIGARTKGKLRAILDGIIEGKAPTAADKKYFLSKTSLEVYSEANVQAVFGK